MAKPGQGLTLIAEGRGELRSHQSQTQLSHQPWRSKLPWGPCVFSDSLWGGESNRKNLIKSPRACLTSTSSQEPLKVSRALLSGLWVPWPRQEQRTPCSSCLVPQAPASSSSSSSDTPWPGGSSSLCHRWLILSSFLPSLLPPFFSFILLNFRGREGKQMPSHLANWTI